MSATFKTHDDWIRFLKGRCSKRKVGKSQQPLSWYILRENMSHSSFQEKLHKSGSFRFQRQGFGNMLMELRILAAKDEVRFEETLDQIAQACRVKAVPIDRPRSRIRLTTGE